MISALLLATAVTSSGSEPIRVSALEEAAGYCQWKVGGKDGQYDMPAGSVMYENWGADVIALMKSKGMPVGPTFPDLPELVVRFASMQPAGRSSGLAPDRFEYMSFGRGDAKAWTVSYPKMAACDIMVTGSAQDFVDRDALLGKIKADGWKQSGSPIVQNTPLWKIMLVKPATGGAKALQATMQGLPPELASPDGVQLEIQFVQSADLQ